VRFLILQKPSCPGSISDVVLFNDTFVLDLQFATTLKASRAVFDASFCPGYFNRATIATYSHSAKSGNGDGSKGDRDYIPSNCYIISDRFNMDY